MVELETKVYTNGDKSQYLLIIQYPSVELGDEHIVPALVDGTFKSLNNVFRNS